MWQRVADFFKVLVVTAGILGAFAVLLVWRLGNEWVEANGALLFTHGFYLTLGPPTLWALRSNRDASAFSPPKVRKILDSGIMLVDPSEWLSYRTFVAIYSLEDDVEHFLCAGYVVNIQANKRVQIQPVIAGDPAKSLETMKNKRSTLVIKPGVHP